MRGENAKTVMLVGTPEGSSPHARGKLGTGFTPNPHVRLIPACAGKTTIDWDSDHVIEAHPRMRGENMTPIFISCARGGSSPHARGKPRLQTASSLASRLIPACAGKTAMVEILTVCSGAHPRMRGENGLAARPLFCGRGSSPHARGKLKDTDHARLLRGSSPHARGKPYFTNSWKPASGLIPACAGKTCGFP